MSDKHEIDIEEKAEDVPHPSVSTIMALMKKIQEETSRIPEEQTAALATIAMCLHVINAYAEWCDGLKGEVIRMDKVIQTQTATIKKVFQTGPKIILPDLAS